jgi:hypothetical protein
MRMTVRDCHFWIRRSSSHLHKGSYDMLLFIYSYRAAYTSLRQEHISVTKEAFVYCQLKKERKKESNIYTIPM